MKNSFLRLKVNENTALGASAFSALFTRVCDGEEIMTKGKPWDINEVRQLRQLVGEGKGIDEISRVMVKTLDAIRQKVFDLDLKVLKEKNRWFPPEKSLFFFF